MLSAKAQHGNLGDLERELDVQRYISMYAGPGGRMYHHQKSGRCRWRAIAFGVHERRAATPVRVAAQPKKTDRRASSTDKAGNVRGEKSFRRRGRRHRRRPAQRRRGSARPKTAPIAMISRPQKIGGANRGQHKASLSKMAERCAISRYWKWMFSKSRSPT